MAAVRMSRTGKAGHFEALSRPGGWQIFGPKGAVGSVLPESFYAFEGAAALEAYAAGRTYQPTVASQPPPALVAAKRAQGEALEHGRDQCFTVSRHVRALAASEAQEGGTFQKAVESQKAEQWPGFERELFARLHGSAEPIGESPDADAWTRAVHDQVDQVPEWRELQAYAKGDPWAAGIGAAEITKSLSLELGDILDKAPQEDAERVREDGEVVALEGGQSEPYTEHARELEKHGAVTALRIAGKDVQIRQSVSEAADLALGEIRELQAGMAALGAGTQPGVASRVKGPASEVRKLLQKNSRVRRIAQIAGRMKIRAREAQRSKVNYVPEQIVDVTLGAELQRLLPSETMLLAEGETELLLLKKLLERQALEYRLEGREREDQGPIILCVDGSGSMKGARHEWAMGLALALLEICATQRRAFALLHFDTVVQKEWLVTKPAGLPLDLLAEMVCYFSDGGTDFAPPLNRARDLILTSGLSKADVILLTDGDGNWGQAVAGLKAQQARVYGVGIGTDFGADQKAELSGSAFLPDLTLKNETELEVIFSGI